MTLRRDGDEIVIDETYRVPAWEAEIQAPWMLQDSE